MTRTHRGTVIVAGAGIGGLTAAAGLSRAGYEVLIQERARELRPTGTALSLMANALVALDTLDIRPDFTGRAVVFDRLRFLSRRGRPIRTLHFGPIADRLGVPNLAVHRAALQEALLEQAADCKLELGNAVTGYTADPDGVTVTLADGRTVRGDALVGADGFGSAVRRSMVGAETPTDAGYLVWRATPSFTHPVVTPAYAAHYWGRGQRFGLVDLGGGRVYWWGTKNMTPQQTADWRGGRAEIGALYRGWAQEVQEVIAATPDAEISSLPAQDRPFRESWTDGRVTLLGDAAHPMLSSLGQGAAIAIEDGVVLAHCLDRAGDIGSGLLAYQDARRERARAMVEGSRALSAVEQLEAPLRTAGRSLYFRFVPERTLAAQNEASLTFPGVPA